MPKPNPEEQLLNLLKSVLPKAVPDAKLAEKIFDACQKEISEKDRFAAFDKFCKRAELPDLEKKSIEQVKKQFEESFGKGSVSIVPHPKKEALTVEVETSNGIFEGIVKVGAKVEIDSETGEEVKITYVPFPISMDTDPELIWLLGRDERLSPEEAAISLSKAQENFWESKAGQEHLSKRTERTFPEFISKVPSKALAESGLKRHYKDPEPLKQIRPIKARKHDKAAA
jgi:hypothetical protein